ncbi:MAG TPA: helix-turn-helix transcriptional regulator [Sphingomicrobium sp.]|nr:helix-turn-helix transcriptional regulator [Sphingomicrobium sp.]
MSGANLPAEAIYDAILDDDWFAELPSVMARRYGGRSCNMLWGMRDGSHHVLAKCGYYPDAELANYLDNFADKDIWAQRALAPDRVNRAHDVEGFVSKHEYEQSEFYNDWIRAMGDDAYYCVGMMLNTSWGTGLIGIHKGKSQDGFSDASVKLLSDDGVHLRKLFAVRGRLAALVDSERKGSQLLDVVKHPVMSVTRDGRLVKANAAADAVLAFGQSLFIRNGVVRAISPPDEKQLHQAIRKASQPDNPVASAVAIGRSGPNPTHVTVMPLRWDHGPRLAVLMLGLGEAPSATTGQLRTLFQLSSAEADLAIRLSQGASPAAIAAERGVSVGTVRSQLKSVYSKMQCSRQAEVVALIKSLPNGFSA